MKVPLCHYRLMHRKRVTSELHDSYFRLMTIKHSIFKDRVGVERLYNSVEFEEPVEFRFQLSSTASEVADSWRPDVVGKATSGRRGLWALMNWDPEKMLSRCSKESQVFVAASHQTRLDTRSKARRPIKVGIKGRGSSWTSRDSNPACLCCSSAHLVQCEPDEASSFTNPNVGPGTYAS